MRFGLALPRTLRPRLLRVPKTTRFYHFDSQAIGTLPPPLFNPHFDYMPRSWNVTFLGTCSGGGPCLTRNCSSLVADVSDNGNLWMVDCAEGTLRQFDFQPHWGGPKASPHKVKKLFVTHMHADHVMGIVPFLRRILYAPDHKLEDAKANPYVSIEIFGPAGLRQFIRYILQATYSTAGHKYVVHELLSEGDAPTPCDVMHESEVAGRDILRDKDGFWREITTGFGTSVDAGPIEHRVPCFGYVFNETQGTKRQIVVLGDTYDPHAMIPLCNQPSLLIHEATDAYVHPSINTSERRTEQEIIIRSHERGHSLPAQAGAFAKAVDAKLLVLNHIGSRFPVPGSHGHRQANVLNEIERQASEAWGSGIRAQAAYDYLNVEIPVPHPREKAGRGDDDSNGMLEGKRKDRSWEQGGSTGDRNYDHEHKRG